MIRLRIKRLELQSSGRPAFFATPLPWYFRQIQLGCVPVTHVNRKARLVHNASIVPLKPLVPPAHRKVAPLDRRSPIWLVRPVMIPRPENGLNRSLHLLQHLRDAVAVTVVET